MNLNILLIESNYLDELWLCSDVLGAFAALSGDKNRSKHTQR